MKAQAYEGYFEDGRFYPTEQRISIEGRRRALITIFDEPSTENEHAQAWQEFLEEIQKIDDEPVPEFKTV